MSKHLATAPADYWPILRREAEERKNREPLMAGVLVGAILDHEDFAGALTRVLADELANVWISASALQSLMESCHREEPSLAMMAQRDLAAVLKRDPAAASPIVPFLFFKGYQALQAWRIAHYLWLDKRDTLAYHLQSSISKRFSVDIHPAARIGCGVMFDHATGIVIGETAVIEDNVSLLHGVTLGGTGKECGDRHPKIRRGVMIGAGAKILGNIEVGEGALVAAGSVVLENVPPHMTVAGVPARLIGDASSPEPAEDMNQLFPCEGISR